jgi:hypothetical protein
MLKLLTIISVSFFPPPFAEKNGIIPPLRRNICNTKAHCIEWG